MFRSLACVALLLSAGPALAQTYPPPGYPPPGYRPPPPGAVAYGRTCRINAGPRVYACPLPGHPRPLGERCHCPEPPGRVAP